MRHHFTVSRALAVDGKAAAQFIVEIDPERLIALKGARALRSRRGTAILARGAVKIMALVKQKEVRELELG